MGLLALAHLPSPPTAVRTAWPCCCTAPAAHRDRPGTCLLPVADEQRILLLAPKSTAATWDTIGIGIGRDVRRIDGVLQEVFAVYPVSGILIRGFSDGASYDLSIGLLDRKSTADRTGAGLWPSAGRPRAVAPCAE